MEEQNLNQHQLGGKNNMSYIELYSDQILDAVSIGKTSNNFDEAKGDYIKVQVFRGEAAAVLGTLYSNRLLLKHSTADSYHLDDYHFHPENPSMGFCEGRIHNDNSISQLQAMTLGNSADEPLNPESKYKKQVDIFKDDKGNIYIKPNEILQRHLVPQGQYRIKLDFLNLKYSSICGMSNLKPSDTSPFRTFISLSICLS